MPDISSPRSTEQTRHGAGRTVFIALGVLAAIVVSFIVVGEPASDTTAVHTVLIEGMKFKPEALEARMGDRVVFKNIDFVPHTATSDVASKFDSGVLESGKSWSFVCEEEGNLPYRCTLHPVMTGSITVLPAN